MVKRKTANINVRRVRESNVPIFGAILNNINVNVAGYYYSHYYDSSYKHYYLHHEDAAARQTMLSDKGAATKAPTPDKVEKA
jgi:polysaccharide biosynthesis transport protein